MRDRIVTFVRVVEHDGRVTDIRMIGLHWAREAARLLSNESHIRCAFVLPFIREGI